VGNPPQGSPGQKGRSENRFRDLFPLPAGELPPFPRPGVPKVTSLEAAVLPTACRSIRHAIRPGSAESRHAAHIRRLQSFPPSKLRSPGLQPREMRFPFPLSSCRHLSGRHLVLFRGFRPGDCRNDGSRPAHPGLWVCTSDILLLPPGACLIYKRLRCGSTRFQ
jgi:hypothetical protein